jgi:DnaJ-domain-containing protein 1
MRQDSGTDYHELADPEFLAERARVRELLERTSEDADNYAELAEILARMDDEFIRRARGAWSEAMPRRTAGTCKPVSSWRIAVQH